MKFEEIRRLTKMGMWKYLSLFYNRCDCIVAPSDDIKNKLENHYMKRKIVVTPTPYENKKIRVGNKPSIRKKYGFDRDDKILLHVGRLTKEKNIMFIIKSLKKLLEKENVKLLIASDGPYKHALEEEVRKLSLEKAVIFTGYLSEKELKEIYRLSDAFIFASSTETQALVLLDAVINGLPIIALDAPVVSDFILENGVGLISDKKDFSKITLRILEEKGLSTRFEKNKKNVIKKFNADARTQDLIKLYVDLCDQYSGSPL
jgi:glycosyltransferase involved in cell wall biosynthesis